MNPFNFILSLSKYLLKGAFLLFVALVLFTTSVKSQGVNVKATLDSTRILIGQQLTLHLEAEFSAQDTIQWPAFADTITKNIEILSITTIDTSYDANDVAIKRMLQDITITSFDSGYFYIPPVHYIINGNDYETAPLLIQVFDMPVDTAKGIADIKEPYQVPFSFKEWLEYNWHWIALGLAVILIIIFLIYFIKKQKNKPVPLAKPKPKVPAHKTALKRLQHLEQQRLWQNGKLKNYHSEVSDIIREYIEDRFDINALEQTSIETIESLKHIDIDTKLKEKLQQTLSISDMVKFAKAVPVASENEACLQNCLAFVNGTIPQPKPIATDE